MDNSYKLPDSASFSANDLIGFVYTDKEQSGVADVMRLHVDGESEVTNTEKAKRVYLVLAGEGVFTINNDKEVPVVKEDVVVLPENTVYKYNGSMELFEVNVR